MNISHTNIQRRLISKSVILKGSSLSHFVEAPSAPPVYKGNDADLVTLAAAVSLADVQSELVLLIAAHVRVAHEEERVVVLSGHRGHKVKRDLRLLLKSKSLDRDQRVCFWIADHNPPALLAFLQHRQPVSFLTILNSTLSYHPTELLFSLKLLILR